MAVFALLTARSGAGAADPFAENVRTTDPLTPEQEQRTFHLPRGFEIQLVAAEPDLRKPMNMAFDAAGRLWITESREYPFPAKPGELARDTIRIFSDFDANGRARTVTTFATNLNIPIGIYPFRSPAAGGPTSASARTNRGAGGTAPSPGRQTWKCIAWSIPNIWLFEDTDGDGKADKQEVLFGPFDHTRDTHGNQASFRRGFDGWLYATHGFNNDSHVKGRDGHQVDLNSGNTYRMRLDGSRIEHWTHGQVNPFGLGFDSFGNLFSSDCHSEPIYQLLAGGSYPSFGKPHDGLGFAPTMMEKPRGSTALDGISCVADDRWPEEFRDNLFIGDVMTSSIYRDRTVEVGATKIAKPMPDFVRTDDPWFRPVDTRLGPDGALYIADFYNRIIGHYEVPLNHPGRDRERGRIWRVVPPSVAALVKARSDSPLPNRVLTNAAASAALPTTLDGLVAELGSPSLARRMLAMNEICDRFSQTAGNADVLSRAFARAVKAGASNPSGGSRDQEWLIAHGLWILDRLGRLDDPTLNRAAMTGILARVHALRLVTERGRQRGINPLREGDTLLPLSLTNLVWQSLGHADALVRRCAAEALGAWPAFDHVRPLLDALSKADRADTHLVHVLRLALRDQLKLDRVLSRLMKEPPSERDARALADVAVAVPTSEAGAFLLQHIQRYDEQRDSMVRYLRHAARYAPETRMDALAAFTRNKFAGDVELQLALFKSVQDGTSQRGAALEPACRTWGAELAEKLLAASEEASVWHNAPLDGMKETKNPWFVQQRASADGDKASPFLCSLPPGGEQLTGSLRSMPFAIPPKLSFFLAGHDGFPDKPAQKRNVVRLRAAETHAVLAETYPPRNDLAQPYSWDLGAHAGRQGYLEIVDGDNGGAYAWLAVGRFNPPAAPMPAINPSQLAQQQQAAADLARTLLLTNLEPQLTRLLGAADAELDSRAAAARALAALRPSESVVALAPLVGDPSVPVDLRKKISEALAERETTRAQAVLLEALRASAYRVQVKLAQTLAGSLTGAESLLDIIERGQAAPRLLLERPVKDRLLAANPAKAGERLTRLTKGLTPVSEDLQMLIEKRRAAYSPTKASTAEGVKVFEKTCAVCHQIDGKGGLVGPQLEGIGNRGLERLLEDVLDPNRNVDLAFRSHILVLKDGEVVSGLPRREEGELLVLADSTGKEISVAKQDITQRRESESSPMPDNFGEIISPEDFNHLMAFLLSKRAKQ